MSDTSLSTTVETSEPLVDATEDAPSYGEFRIGTVLGKSFKIFFRNIVPFMLITLIITSPSYIGKITAINDFLQDPDSIFIVWIVPAFNVLGWILGVLVTAAITYGTYQDLAGRKTSIMSALRHGLPRVFPALLVTLLVGLLAGLGAIVFLIPGIILWTIFLVVIPATVVEKLGVSASMTRSADLTRGYRWKVFGAYLVMIIVSLVAGIVLSTIFLSLATMLFPDNAGLILGVSEMASQTFSSCLLAVVVSVIYSELRIAKEGADIEQIAAVFD